MKTVKVHYSNGDSIITSINGTIGEIEEYFKVGKQFNIGSVEDNMQTVKRLEFLRYEDSHITDDNNQLGMGA